MTILPPPRDPHHQPPAHGWTPTESETEMTDKTPTQRGIDAIRADTLRKAAADLRDMGISSPYMAAAAPASDTKLRDHTTVDHAYAAWLDQRAEEATS